MSIDNVYLSGKTVYRTSGIIKFTDDHKEITPSIRMSEIEKKADGNNISERQISFLEVLSKRLA